MKKVAVSILNFYHIFLSEILRQLTGVRNVCLNKPTCSEYMKLSIVKYGVLKGLKKGVIRLAHCQPFAGNK